MVSRSVHKNGVLRHRAAPADHAFRLEQRRNPSGTRKQGIGLTRRRWLRVWVKPSFEEIWLCAEVTAYVYSN